jgi:5-methylcytosine-specific restriction protein A
VIELSELLKALPIHAHRPDAEKFRNPNGVSMKLSNFLRFDPSYQGKGLPRGNRLEREVWDEAERPSASLLKLPPDVTPQAPLAEHEAASGDTEEVKCQQPRWDYDDQRRGAGDGRVAGRDGSGRDT